MNETRTLSLVLQTPKALPPFIVGHYGIGKTAQVKQLVEYLRWESEMIRPGERGEGAFGVVPVPDRERNVLTYPIPEWAERLKRTALVEGKDGLVFIDEATSIPPALQPAIRGLALDGIIGGDRLPENVRRCAAGTPTDQAAGGWDMAADLANRWVYLSWDAPKADQWCDWLMAGDSYRPEVIRLDQDAWEREWPQAKALGCAFMRSHPLSLIEDDDKVKGRNPPAVATPRTWECALRLLASCRAMNCMDLYPALAQGCLGPAVATQGVAKPEGAWLVWLANNDLADPEALLKDPASLRDHHDPKRPDRTFAALLAVAEAGLATVNGKKLSNDQRAERWEAAFAVMWEGLSMKLGKDIVLLPTRALVNRDRRPKCKTGPYGLKVCGVLSEFIDIYEPR